MPTLPQSTSLGCHSVLIRDMSRSSFFEPQLGHGGAGLSEDVERLLSRINTEWQPSDVDWGSVGKKWD